MSAALGEGGESLPAARQTKQGPGDCTDIPYAVASAAFCGAVRGAGLSPASPRAEGALRAPALVAALLLLEGKGAGCLALPGLVHLSPGLGHSQLQAKHHKYSVFSLSLLGQLVYRSVSQASLSTACPVQTLSLS